MQPTATRGRAAVHSINHFALQVPSLTEARRFYEACGFELGTGTAIYLEAGSEE